MGNAIHLFLGKPNNLINQWNFSSCSFIVKYKGEGVGYFKLKKKKKKIKKSEKNSNMFWLRFMEQKNAFAYLER